MEKISTTQIKSFKCIKPIVYHWGVQLEIGEMGDVIDGGKKTETIIFDLENYNRESPSMPVFPNRSTITEAQKKQLKEEMDEYRRLKKPVRDKYSIEIEYNWLVIIGREHGNEFNFVFESEDEIKEKYNIDKNCRLHFPSSVYHFPDYFDKTQLNRELNIIDLFK